MSRAIVRTATSLAASVALFLLSGCRPPPTPAEYEGPTDPLVRVVDDINQNNQRIATIWARGDFRAWIVDEKHRSHYVNGDAFLMYRAPHDLRLIGKKVLVDRIFDMGSNGDQYWLIVKPEIDTMWYGDFRHAAPAGSRQIPIRPDLLLEVLGVGTIDTDLTRQPVPVMRFNNAQDAYMLVWHVKSSTPPDRWVAVKEVWYDRKTRHPTLIQLFDEDGRVVLRAKLSEHRKIQDDTSSDAPQPWIAGPFDLYFPQSKTKMELSLSEVEKTNKGIPSDKSFAFPGVDAAAKTINIDEETGP
jgi:hypothetical protein